MSDPEVEDLVDERQYDDSTYQSCYIFRPSHQPEAVDEARPRKRRKVIHGSINTFPTLPGSHDTENLVNLRTDTFQSFWEQQSQKLSSTHVDEHLVSDVVRHVAGPSTSNATGRLATAVVLAGLDENAHHVVLERLKRSFAKGTQMVSLHKRQCPNLQSALRNLIKAVVITHSGLQAYTDLINKQKRLLPLNFDLELLGVFVSQSSLDQVVVSLFGVETFDAHVLDEFIRTLHAWRRSMCVRLILGVTSTRQLFERRLSKTCLGFLRAEEFDFRPKTTILSRYLKFGQIFDAEDDVRVFLAPNIVAALAEVTTSQGSTEQSFVRMLQYIYLSHLAANPLSVLANHSSTIDESDATCLAASIRHTESFQHHCQSLLADKSQSHIEHVRMLLHDDQRLLFEARTWVKSGQRRCHSAIATLHSLAQLYRALQAVQPLPSTTDFDPELQLYANISHLDECNVFGYIESVISQIPTTDTIQALRTLETDALSILGLDESFAQEQENSTATRTNAAKGGRTAARLGSKITKTDQPMGRSLCTSLRTRLRAASLDVNALILHEVYLISSKAVRFRQSFDPQPRAAIERALVKPQDYLDWKQTGRYDQHGQSPRSSTTPAAAALFTSLQEAPTIINVRDLLDAFRSKSVQPQSANEEEGDRSLMGVFYRSLAEMKAVGFLKPSTGTQIKRGARSKAHKMAAHDIDYVAKTSWATL